MDNNLYRCDSCKKTFTREEIEFEPYINNIEVYGGKFTAYNTITKKTYQTTTKDLIEDDCVFCCPYCNQSHPFGFDEVKV